MQRTSASPVQSFTTGFWDVRYDEAKYAKKVATLLGTEHHEIYVDAPEAMAVISKLPAIYDEPFSDVSQIPTSLISVHARRNVKVVLSGDGGDEIFGGYVRYLLAMRLWLWARRTPDWLKVALARSIKSLPTNFYSACFGFLSPWVKRYSDPGPLGDKIHKLADILEACPADGLDQWLGSHWKEQIIKTGDGGLPPWRRSVGNADLEGFARRMMLNDLEAYLPDDVLTKVDRASMAVGLEVRVPLLDHRVVEFAAQLPLSMKIRNGRGKLVLRHVLSRYLPKDLVERPKAGFGVPVAEWLRGPLKDWASDMLSEYKLRQEGWLDSAAVLAKWKEHLSRRRNWEYPLWTVLMFEAWLGENLKAVRPQVAPVEHVQ
jgi:asparagine synthase (glutamine-hydrolysing)